MPRRPGATRRWATAISWPVGIALICWDCMWRTTPLHRRGVVVDSPDGHRPPELPEGVEREEVVGAESGHGPLFHRRYRARVRGAALTAEGLLGAIEENLNRAAPRAFARLIKVKGARGVMRIGDEYVVRMPGPWDGPARVVAQRAARLARGRIADGVTVETVRVEGVR